MQNSTGVLLNGKNNTILLIKDGKELPYEPIEGLKITINGNNNTVKIELPSRFINTTIAMDGDNNFISIKQTKHRLIRHSNFGMAYGGTILVGEGLSAYRNVNIIAKSGRKIEIGNECMFARDILIRNNDGHVILDKTTNEILNPPKDIAIEDNVWIGARSVISKGTKIPRGSVVAAMSFVNKSFDEENILLGGVPAKKLRENIRWVRDDYDSYVKKSAQ